LSYETTRNKRLNSRAAGVDCELNTPLGIGVYRGSSRRERTARDAHQMPVSAPIDGVERYHIEVGGVVHEFPVEQIHVLN
jgi:hypothetical protein